ncbi:MAG: O-antigen polymerase [Hydrogenophaga sp.]|nr:O-antigen polymerase [Hydrogenophaga sp.]
MSNNLFTLRSKQLIPFGLILSLLLMSPFGSNYFLNFFGLYIAEIGILMLIFSAYIANKGYIINISRITFKPFLVYLYFIFFILLLVGILNHGNFVAAYTDLRVLIILALSISISYHYIRDRESLYWLYWLTIACLAFNFIYWLIFFDSIDRQGSKFSFPLSAFVLSMLLAALLRRIDYLILAFLLAAVCALISSFRMAVIVVIVSFFGYLLCLILSNNNSTKYRIQGKIKALLILATIFLTSIFFLNLSTFVTFFIEDESRYIQTIVKWEYLFNYLFKGEAIGGGDDTRLLYYQYLIDNFKLLSFPQGLGHKASIDIINHNLAPTIYQIGASTLDSSWFFLLYHFGYILLAISLFLYLIFNHFYLPKISRNYVLYLLVTLFLTIFFMSLTAVHFTEISSAISFGLLAGLSAKIFKQNLI